MGMMLMTAPDGRTYAVPALMPLGIGSGGGAAAGGGGLAHAFPYPGLVPQAPSAEMLSAAESAERFERT
jgi:hypothetical protein